MYNSYRGAYERERQLIIARGEIEFAEQFALIQSAPIPHQTILFEPSAVLQGLTPRNATAFEFEQAFLHALNELPHQVVGRVKVKGVAC